MKKILISLLLIILGLMVIGCSKEQSMPSNSFFIEVSINEYGGVEQTIGIPCFSKEISKYYEKNQIEKYIKDLNRNIEESLYNNYYISYWIKYLESPDNRYAIGGDVVKFQAPFYDEKQDTIIFSFNFLTSSAWKFYNNSTNTNNEDNLAIEKPFNFISTISSESIHPFSKRDLKGQMVGDYYLNVVKESLSINFDGFNLNDININYLYNYIPIYKRLHSNADLMTKKEGREIHSWTLNKDSLNEGRDIKIWLNEANKGWWYLSSLLAIIILSSIIFIIIFIKK